MGAQDQAQGPLLWQELVTDGHVRAARLRAVQPLLIALGTLLIFVGGWMQIASSPPPIRTRDDLLREEVLRLQMPAVEAVNSLPDLTVRRRDFGKLVPANEIERTIVPRTLESLNKSGRLPDQLILNEVDGPTFWKRPWPFTSLISTGNADTKLLGAIVNLGALENPKLARWMGLFKRVNGRWRYVAIAGPNFYASAPAASINDVALDFSSLLPGAR